MRYLPGNPAYCVVLFYCPPHITVFEMNFESSIALLNGVDPPEEQNRLTEIPSAGTWNNLPNSSMEAAVSNTLGCDPFQLGFEQPGFVCYSN
jgi:hypothetical protein